MNVNNNIEIKCVSIRSWGIRKKRNRLYPYFNITTSEENPRDYTLSSEKEMSTEDWVGIMNVLHLINTKDLASLGCRIALKDDKPFAIGRITDTRWIVFSDEEYYMTRYDSSLW